MIVRAMDELVQMYRTVTKMPQRTQTRAFQAALEGQDITSKVLKILKAIRKEGMNLAIFLDALSWSRPKFHSNAKIRFVQAGLPMSEELPCKLMRWYQPPQNNNKGKLPAVARHVLRKLSLQVTNELIGQVCFSYGDILVGDPMAMERLEKHYIHHNLWALLKSPDFRGYDNLDKYVLQPPHPVCELPCGPDHAVHKHMLNTVDIEETSYEGNVESNTLTT